MSRLCFLPLLVLPLLLSPVAEAAHWVSPENPSEICRSAISKVERAARVPKNLMQAIALVESGRQAPEKRENVAWPWTINAEGKGAFFPTKDAALAEVRRLQAKGVRSIDVGCMQVNLHHHGDNFASLEEAFDPVVNALYAATFLQQLFEETESWSLAVQRYHSANPVKGEPYRAKVDRRWREEHARYADETRNGAIELTRLKRAEAISRHLEINGLRQVDREGDAEAPPTAPARGYQLAQLSLAQRNATNFAGPTVPQSATSATGLGQRASSVAPPPAAVVTPSAAIAAVDQAGKDNPIGALGASPAPVNQTFAKPPVRFTGYVPPNASRARPRGEFMPLGR